MKILICCLILLSASMGFTQERRFTPHLDLIEKDIKSLLTQAGLNTQNFKITWQISANNKAVFNCKSGYQLAISSQENEKISTAYYALRQLGFLFPHPRISLIPKSSELIKHCGKSWTWEPLLKDRGFHLHTQHAGEWTHAFFMGQTQIAQDTLWWLARNQQNLVQLQTLRLPDAELKKYLDPSIELAHNLGIQFGLSFSFAMIQQKNYYLIPLWRALTGIGEKEALRARIQELIALYDFDYVTSELGTTEFTSISEENTLKWIEILQEELSKNKRGFFIKAHVSSNQVSEKYGNFNFLPQYSSSGVSLQAHTVFFYGLLDEHTPMYGRQNFEDMKKFMLQEQSKRQVWYFPETSYYIAMDIDIPLLLTDYLLVRAADMKFLKDNHFTGQVNFSTGQELGYWLFDWNLALLTDSKLQQDPLAGLKLLGEDPKVWQKILVWQNEFVKKQQLIQALSSANLMDDLYPLAHKTHERYLLRELKSQPEILKSEIEKLKMALLQKPDLGQVKNEELRFLLMVTELRMQHALKLREALADDSQCNKFLEEAQAVREQALVLVREIQQKHNRYPDSFVFEQKENASSYPYGYGWPAVTLHFWEREENQIRYHQTWNAFYMNIYNPLRILL